jgi:hypothetical protein
VNPEAGALALGADLWVGQPEIAGTSSRRKSSANTQASMRSVLQASGASPLTFCQSVDVRRDGAGLDAHAIAVERVEVEPLAAEVQSDVQH